MGSLADASRLPGAMQVRHVMASEMLEETPLEAFPEQPPTNPSLL